MWGYPYDLGNHHIPSPECARTFFPSGGSAQPQRSSAWEISDVRWFIEPICGTIGDEYCLVLVCISIGFTTLFIFVVHSVVIDPLHPLLKDMPWLEEVSKFDPCPLCCIWTEVICLSQGCGTTALVTRFFETLHSFYVPVPQIARWMGRTCDDFFSMCTWKIFGFYTWHMYWFANTTWHCLACFRIFHYLYPSILFVPFDGYSIIWLTLW